ncbi:hypothetical protein GCM10023188_11170 [Pontibacter saemangeumensis]|uniref:Por secretion system C-terminal sorting domain-containing protein n=1 Tax=Pontibacter saemangeumensis TaxID=1084525 RepID=A0ABP8LFT2_9BACT
MPQHFALVRALLRENQIQQLNFLHMNVEFLRNKHLRDNLNFQRGLLVLVFFLLSAFGAQAQTVTTDKDDYSPGQYVTITGSGWQPGERVDFSFEETPKPATCVNPHDLFAIADQNGNIFNNQFLVKENHLGVAFVLTATGESGSIAVTNFTDAGISNVTVVGSTFCIGGPISISFDKISAQNNSVTGQFKAGATFIAELTNTAGTSNLGEIGRITDTGGGNGGLTIEGAIPTAAQGTSYRVRIRSINPETNNPINGINFTINPVPSAPTASSNSPLFVGGTLNLSASAISGATYSWTGPNNFTSNLREPSISNITSTAGGTYSVTATVGSCTSLAGTVNVVINNIWPTSLAVAPATGTYGGTTTLSATLTSNTNGVAGKTISFSLNGNSVVTAVTNSAGIATLSGTSLAGINADSYPTGVTASFAADAAYSASSGNAALTVNKASTTTIVTITGTPFVYTGEAITPASVSVTGPGLAITPAAAYSNNINAGLATASFSYAESANYLASSDSKNFTINKATATLTLATLSHVYDGTEKSATATTYPVGLTGVSVSGSGTDFGTYEANASLDNANYTATAVSGMLSISKASSVVSMENVTATYNGSAHAASATATGAGGLNTAEDITYSYAGTGSTIYPSSATAPTNAGTYSVTATYAGGANHSGSSKVATVTITPAQARITLADLQKTYNGSAQGATATTSPEGLSVNVTYAGSANVPTAAGTYAVVAALNNSNYTAPNGTGSLVIAKAHTTILVTVSNATYDGSSKAGSANVTGAGGLDEVVAVTYSGVAPTVYSSTTAPTNAGTYTATATFSESANYLGSSDSKSFTINKATATLALDNLSFEYDGTVKSATAVTSPAGLTGVNISNNGKTNAGTYEVVATLDNPNYTAAPVKDNLLIAQKPLAVVVANKSKVYGTDNPELTGTFSGAVESDGITVSYATTATKTSDVVAGGYPITATLADPNSKLANYIVSNTPAVLTITQAPATITVAGLDKTYNGSAQGATVTTSPAGLEVNVTYAGADDVPTAAGRYAVVAALNNGNYTAANGTGILVIAPKALAGSFTAERKVYDGNTSAAVLARAVAGAVEGDEVSLIGGTATFATASAGTGKTVTLAGASLAGADAGNYSLTSVGTTTADITAKEITGTFAADNKVYDGNTSAAVLTRSLNGVVGEDAVTLSGGTATFATASAGTGKTVTLAGASLAGDDKDNYNLTSVATATATITTKGITASLANAGKVYDGTAAAPGTTATLSGVIEGDDVTADVSAAAFSSADAGPRTVTATVVLSGAAAGNYSLGTVTPANATITAKSITAAIAADNKVYDGTDVATATGSATGVNGTAVAVTVSNAKFADANVGTAKSVTAGVAISDANYSLTAATASTTANITPALLTITAPSMSKYCGQVDPATGYTASVSGAVNREVITTSYSIAGTVVTALSTDAKLSNYTVKYIDGTLTINTVTLDVSNASTPRSISEDVNIAVLVKDVTTNLSAVNVSIKLNGTVVKSDNSLNGIVSFNLGRLPVGVHLVEVVTGNGCAASTSSAYLPIYDPNGGFVTGGGWIDSKAGAVRTTAYGLAGNEAVGKANFGFVAKYKTGKSNTTEVDGNTEFQFTAGKLNFKSTSHESMSLVVAPDKATYRGLGTLNGLAGFKFTVIATDGDAKGRANNDRFRIRIWDAADALVYDNLIGTSGAEDYAEASDVIGGGSIVIHQPVKGGSTTSKAVAAATEAPELAGTKFFNYPNPYTDRTAITFSSEKEESFALEVYDVKGALVKKVDRGVTEAGKVYEYDFESRNLPEGVYFARLITTSGVQTIKMVLKK